MRGLQLHMINGSPKPQAHAVLFHPAADFRRNVLIGRQRKHAGRKVRQHGANPALRQKLRHLDPHHGGAHHHGALHLFVLQRPAQPQSVLICPHKKASFRLQPRNRRGEGRRAGGDQDFIVGSDPAILRLHRSPRRHRFYRVADAAEGQGFLYLLQTAEGEHFPIRKLTTRVIGGKHGIVWRKTRIGIYIHSPSGVQPADRLQGVVAGCAESNNRICPHNCLLYFFPAAFSITTFSRRFA